MAIDPAAALDDAGRRLPRLRPIDHLDRPGAVTALDRVLRLDSQVMLVDDPVKRVDNMTMAWGLEARTPFLDHEFAELAAAVPPELKLAQGGKGVLKEASRAGAAGGDHRPQEGSLPGAGDHQPGGPLPGAGSGTRSPTRTAQERDLFRPEYVDTLLSDPNRHRTPLGSNQLWQLGLLEMWLQRHGIG